MVPILCTSQNSYSYTILYQSMDSTPFPFPLPDFSELQEMNWNVESIMAPVQSEVNSSPFDLISTIQPDLILSSSENNNNSDENFTNPSNSYQSSSSDEEATVEKIKRKLSMYRSMLNNPESAKKKKFSNFRVDQVGDQTHLHRSIDIVENSFQKAMHEANTQGYVYGIILKDNTVISGSSLNLRKWWHETVRFGTAGTDAVSRYETDQNRRNLDRNGNGETLKRTYDALMEISDATLGSLLSVLMNRCEPPQRKFPFEKKTPPPWWPTGMEPWWNQIGNGRDLNPPPYKKPHDLRKIWKAAAAVAIIKHTAPGFDGLARVVKQSKNVQGRMSAKEMTAWNSVLEREARIYSRDHPDQDRAEGFQSHVSSVCDWKTEHGTINYTCDHVRFGTPIEQLPAFPENVCQDTNNGPLFGPVTCEPVNRAYEDVTVAFFEMDPQQRDFSFDGYFGSSNYSAIPSNNDQHVSINYSAIPNNDDQHIFGHGFFNGEGGRYGDAELFK